MENRNQSFSYTIELVLKKQDGNTILYLSQAIESFKKLYSEVAYILNERKTTYVLISYATTIFLNLK